LKFAPSFSHDQRLNTEIVEIKTFVILSLERKSQFLPIAKYSEIVFHNRVSD